MLGWDDLPPLFPELEDPGRWLPLLQQHASILEQHAPAIRTTSVGHEEMVGRHYAECLELLRIVRGRLEPGPAADVGSGGGFPGLVFAAVEPEWPIALVEPLKKRARLLESAVEALGLRHVQVVALRAEEAGRTSLREQATLVTARAVAPMAELLEYCAPLARTGGLIALPKGTAVREDLAGARAAYDILHCELEEVVDVRPEVSATPYVVLLRKTGPVPEQYPRRPGAPRKRPIGS